MTNLVTLVHPTSGGRVEVVPIRVPQLKRQGWREEKKEKPVEASKTSTETTEATGAEASKKENK